MASDLDIGMKCVKYMLFITNFMFVVSVKETISSIIYRVSGPYAHSLWLVHTYQNLTDKIDSVIKWL